MSTIFGLFNRNNKNIINKSIILDMDDALSYWESDDKGIWSADSITLAHKMLWSTPESKLEHLPRVVQHKNHIITITMDARLDNREELVKIFHMTGCSIGQITDSELVLMAYKKWGENCPQYLLGDFVFAIWDEKKQQLFCVRDHVGIKSFYYYLSDDIFIFSNDIRGLISHSQIDQQYNDRAIAMYLSEDIGFYDTRDTFFKKIQKLPAATSMIISKEDVLETGYWDIENIAKIKYKRHEEYVGKLRELLIDAVKVRLRTDYPVASHLSGGIDSSSISVLAAREQKKKSQPLYAFNWIETPDEPYDPDYHEWGFASQLVKLENIEQKNIKLTPEFVSEMYDEIDISKEDLIDFGEYLVRDEAHKYEIRTLLSGWGGDELISYDGYAYLSGLLWTGHFAKAIKEITYLYQGTKYKYLRILKRVFREMMYPLFYKQMAGFYQEEKSDYDPYTFIQDSFAVFAREQSFKKLKFHPGVHNEQKVLYFKGRLLQRIESWASSAYEKKLEYSYPLLDKRIVEFALAIPEEMYATREGHQRYLYRSAISDFLPKNICWKTKIGEVEHGKAWVKLWNEALIVWMKRNEKIEDNENDYIDRSKIIKRIKLYLENKQNKVEDDIGNSTIVSSILLLNLKTKE